MNHHDQHAQFAKDEVTRALKQFPHLVKVTWTGYPSARIIHTWCVQHVGERHVWWEWISNDQYGFRNPDHAVQFSLAWSGS